MNDKLKFSHDDYLKLAYPLFPTIRRNDKYPGEGASVTVRTPEMEFEAMIIFKNERELRNIPTRFLRYDTARKGNVPSNRSRAVEVLNSFYRKPLTPSEELTILILLSRQGRFSGE